MKNKNQVFPMMPLGDYGDQFLQIQQQFLQDWQGLLEKAHNDTLEKPQDRRFSAPAWVDNKPALLSAHAYLLLSKTMMAMAQSAGLEKRAQEKLEFSVMQWLDAMSPANFLVSNPAAIDDLIKTQGNSLQQGIANLLGDISNGKITQTDESAFTLGENLAATEGSVIYENELFQLLHYKSLTAKTHKIPLLMVPPCINKYYILDLQPDNSLVRFALESGLDVFMVSWRNPTADDTDDIASKTWDDYIQDGILRAISIVQDVSRQPQINALGFCVGGTMLATALSTARANGEDPVAALTLLTTFLDFSETGVLDVFVNECHALLREQQIGNGGLMPAQELSTTFSFLRPAELVWNYVDSNYLRGKTPRAFDILAWNADGTNLPGPFFTWYFRNTYLENKLITGKAKVCGKPVNLRLDIPTYLYASREDHIVPWKSAFASNQILTGEKRFVLGESGHVAGVINPPQRGKRGYWYDDTAALADTNADQWYENATHQTGSWWSDWADWLTARSGALRAARKTQGNKKYSVIEPAPGRYVKIKA